MKKVFGGVLAALLSLSLIGCGSSKPETPADSSDDTLRIAFVSYQEFDSSEWLQNLVVGLKDYEAKTEGIEIKTIEAIGADTYEPKVLACAQDGFDIIITTYSDMWDATCVVADQFPDIKFGILQAEKTDEEYAAHPNIEEFHLNRTETSFLQGYVAAKMTKTGTVGFVGGNDSQGINEILAGWQQGIAYANNGTADLVAYCNSFTDPTIGKDYAQQLIKQGADIIFGAAGGSGTGCAQAAEEAGIMYAACDAHYPDAAPNSEIGSTLNFFENMVIAFIDKAVSGNFEGGTQHEYGVKEGAAIYEFATTNDLAPQELKDEVADLAAKIAAGEIEISRDPLHK